MAPEDTPRLYIYIGVVAVVVGMNVLGDIITHAGQIDAISYSLVALLAASSCMIGLQTMFQTIEEYYTFDEPGDT